MTVEELIKEKIIENLAPEHFVLDNESHKHVGHAGDDGSGQTHFKLLVVSSAFDGCNRMQRHRMVYRYLDEAFSAGLHALSMNLLTLSEYKEKQ